MMCISSWVRRGGVASLASGSLHCGVVRVVVFFVLLFCLLCCFFFFWFTSVFLWFASLWFGSSRCLFLVCFASLSFGLLHSLSLFCFIVWFDSLWFVLMFLSFGFDSLCFFCSLVLLHCALF